MDYIFGRYLRHNEGFLENAAAAEGRGVMQGITAYGHGTQPVWIRDISVVGARISPAPVTAYDQLVLVIGDEAMDTLRMVRRS